MPALAPTFLSSSFRRPGRRLVAVLTIVALALTGAVVSSSQPARATGTASVSGIVTVAATSDPIAGIRVELWESTGGGGFNFRNDEQTGSDGRYEFLGLQTGLYAIQFTDDQGGFLGRFHDGATELSEASLLTLAEGATVTANVPLDRAASISGVVTRESDGAPLEGITVQGQSNEGGPFRSSQAQTDPAGAYTLSGLDPSRLWTIQFQGEDQGFVSEFYDDEDGFSDAQRLTVNRDAPTTGINAALQLGSTISGTVALSSNPNSPIESAQIRLSREAGGFTHTSFHPTDSLGAFSITGLPEGTYIVEANADGMLTSWWQDAATRADANAIVISSPGQVVLDVDFLLDQGGTISGIVRDSDGNPVVAVRVVAEPSVQSYFGPLPSAVTDANGEYVLTNVASIDYRLSFLPPDGSELSLRYWPSSDTREGAQLVRGIAGGAVTNLSIVLLEGGTVRGRVTSAQTSNPIAGIQVSVDSRQGLGGKFATTDSNGVWEVRGLTPADDYVVSFITGQGHVGELFDNTRSWSNPTLVVVTAGGVRSGVDAALDLSAQVSGRVIDLGGNGIEGIGVSLLLEGSPSNNSGSAQNATTDSTGMWEMPDVAPGNYRVLFGNPWELVPNYRAEWHRDTYNPNASTRVTVSPGGDVTGLNATLAPNTQPAPPEAPTISVSGASSGSPTVNVILPSSGPTAYGFSGGAGSMREGGDIGLMLGSGTADLEFFRGRDAQVLVEAYAFGADGQSASVRELVVFGGGPGIRSTPVVQLNQATRNSLSFSWSISQAHSSVDRWSLAAFPVGGSFDERIFWSSEGSGPTPNVRVGSALIEGLTPATTYEVFVAGSTDEQDTFRSRGLFTTTGNTFTSSPTPVISGTPQVGTQLSATTGSWTPAPVNLALQWLRNGAPISGATGATYTPLPADAGSQLAVRVTGEKTGYTALTRTSAVTAVVLSRISSAPLNLSATPAQRSASLSWTAPATSNGGTITDYVVQFRAGSAGSWITFADGVGTGTTTTVTGLLASTAYQFQVAAVTSFGISPMVSVSTTTPAAPAPPAPPAPAPAPVASPAFRFWSDTYQSHFYTLSVAERNFVDAAYPDNVWKYEGPVFGAFASPVAGSIPVYRFWSSSYNAHFYTASEEEKNHVIDAYPDNVWQYESIAYHAYPGARIGVDTQPMARFWSPTYVNHFFTASVEEAASVRRNFAPRIWTFEGNVFHVPTAYSPAPPLP